MDARWFWAMAQMAPLSLAEDTFWPVLMRFWTVCSADCVALRFCSATRALEFVLMLFAMRATPYFGVSDAVLAKGAFCSKELGSNSRASSQIRRREAMILYSLVLISGKPRSFLHFGRGGGQMAPTLGGKSCRVRSKDRRAGL